MSKSKPFTDTLLPTAGNADCELSPSMRSTFESVSTLIVVTGGVAPVNRGESPVRVNFPVLVSTLPTLPVICEGQRRTKSVVIDVTPPLVAKAVVFAQLLATDLEHGTRLNHDYHASLRKYPRSWALR